MFDALIDRKDGHVAGAAQPSMIEEVLQGFHDGNGSIGIGNDPIHEVRAWGVEHFHRDGGAPMGKQVRGISAK